MIEGFEQLEVGGILADVKLEWRILAHDLRLER